VYRHTKVGEVLTNLNSHYAKFQEIAEGRKLRRSLLTEAQGKRCLNLTIHHCPNSLKPNEGLCFTGDTVPFAQDGVWPIVSNPTWRMYQPGTDANYLNTQFNLQYTRILTCLEKVFSGKRPLLKQCMSTMYYMIIIGKKMVRTPIGRITDTYEDLQSDCRNCHATPTWDFVRDSDYIGGLDLDLWWQWRHMICPQTNVIASSLRANLKVGGVYCKPYVQ